MRKPSDLPYCTQHLREHAPDYFLLCLFAPPEKREALAALYALDTELSHVRHAAREEILAQVRYAWWREALEELFAGHPPHRHPVLDALAKAPFPREALLALVESHRESYPNPPERGQAQAIATALLGDASGWRKARGVIERHRRKFGSGWNSWLHLKLIWTGVF